MPNQYLALIRSDLDPRNTSDAAQWLSLALGHNCSLVRFWLAEQDRENDDTECVAAQMMDNFGDKQFINSPLPIFRADQRASLSRLIKDEHSPNSAERLWPWITTLLSDWPTISQVIIANEALCRGLAIQYRQHAEKPSIEQPNGELLFAVIDLSKDWPRSLMLQK